MSWLYSQALVVEYSAAKFSDGELSAPWSGNLTPQGYSSPDRMTAFSRLSRFGMTFAPLMADRGEELLTWFLAASLVRTSASRAKERESTVSDPGYGEKWHGSLARFDPDSRSWKTAQHSLIEDSGECLETWPRSGTTVAGQCYLLPTLVRRTVANESGLWQTPVADDSANRAAGKFNSRGEPKLSAQVMLPTPSAGQCETRPAKTWNPKSQSGRSLGCMAATNMWPTPHGFSPDGRSNGPSGNELGRAVNQSLVRPLSEQIGGSLNPTWVEWLMGWPLGWTDLKPLETGKCHSAPLQHGDCSHDDLQVRALSVAVRPAVEPMLQRQDVAGHDGPGGVVSAGEFAAERERGTEA